MDEEGYPFDETELIIETKLKRQRRAVLLNDHADVMRELESALARAFHPTRAADSVDSASSSSAASRQAAPAASAVVPFARVDAVSSNSPADHAGLLVGDRVLRFGRLNASRLPAGADALLAVRDLVVASENQRISVVLERPAADPAAPPSTHVVALVPRRWSGPGLLGCLLNPL